MGLPLTYMHFGWVASTRHLRSRLVFYKQVVPLGHRIEIKDMGTR